MTVETPRSGPTLRYEAVRTTPEEKLQILELFEKVPTAEQHKFFEEKNVSPAIIALWSEPATLAKIESAAGRLCRTTVPGRPTANIHDVATNIQSRVIPITTDESNTSQPNVNGSGSNNGHSTRLTTSFRAPDPSGKTIDVPQGEELLDAPIEEINTDTKISKPEAVDITPSKPTPSWLVDSAPKIIIDPKLQKRQRANVERILQEIGLVIGNDPGMQKASEEVERAARNGGHMLLLGETGTGKELFFEVTRCIHNENGPTKRLNCAGLNPQLIESELFGHVKGAFTDAVKDREGAFDIVAKGGTLFLDEIGDLPMDLQAKLLRVLETGEFSAVGDSKTIKLLQNTKIVTATNQDLESLINQRKFRRDLFHRISGNTIRIPPLAKRTPEHRQDLVGHFLEKMSQSSEQRIFMTKPAMALIQAERYPGNVRELRNHVMRARDEADMQQEEIYITDEHVKKTRTSKEEAPIGDWDTEDFEGEFCDGALRMDMTDPTKLRTEIDVTRIQDLDELMRTLEIRITQIAVRYHDFNQTNASAQLKVTRGKVRILLNEGRPIFGSIDPRKLGTTKDNDLEPKEDLQE